MKPIFKPAIALVSLLLSASANAYQFSLGASYSEDAVDFDSNVVRNDRDIINFDIGGAYYFGNVDDSSGPRAEAAFLARQSSIFASYTDGELDFGRNSQDLQGFSLGGRHHFGDSGWLAGGGYGQSATETNLGIDIDTDRTTVFVGKYIGPTTRLQAVAEFTDNSGPGTTGDDKSFRLSLAHLQELSSSKFYAATLRLGHKDVGDGDDAVEASLSGTYYFTRELGLSAGYSYSHGEFTDFHGVELGVSWFITERFSLDFGYRDTKIDNKDEVTISFNDPFIGDFIPVDFLKQGVPDGESKAFSASLAYRF